MRTLTFRATERSKETSLFMTIREAAAYLAVTEGTVYRLIEEFNLPTCVVGGQWHFRAEAIEAWIRGEAEQS